MAELLKLNNDNYHSLQANIDYLSSSQYKAFMFGCEAAEVAKLKGEYEEPDNKAFLIGSYVHAFNEGKLSEFIANNYEKIYQKSGKKKLADFEHADLMINTLQKDEFAMFLLSQGQPEVIMTAELFGAPWKIMIDRYVPGKRWLELKTVKSVNEMYWRFNPDIERNEKVNFIENYHYGLTAALYSEIERIASGGNEWLESILLAVSKEPVPDKAAISLYSPKVPEQGVIFGEYLKEIEQNVPRILALKNGNETPRRCEVCDYCKRSKKLTGLVYWQDVGII